MSAFTNAKRDFPLGAKVEVVVPVNPDWDDFPHLNKVVCGHEMFRDDEDSPIICVCLVSTVNPLVRWFPPKSLVKVSGSRR